MAAAAKDALVHPVNYWARYIMLLDSLYGLFMKLKINPSFFLKGKKILRIPNEANLQHHKEKFRAKPLKRRIKLENSPSLLGK